MNNLKHLGDRVEMIVGSGGVKSGHMVKLSSNTVIEAEDGDGIWGVACDTVDEGKVVAIKRGGVFKFASDGAFVYGDPVYVKDATTVDAGTFGDISCGSIVDEEPEEDCPVYVQITPVDLNSTVENELGGS